MLVAVALVGASQLDWPSLVDRASNKLERVSRGEPLIILDRGSRGAYPNAAPYPADQQCVARLTQNPVHQVRALGEFQSNVCGSNDPIEITALAGVKMSSPVVLGCKSAQALATWLERDLPRALDRIDAPMPSRIHHMGTYSCRKIAGSSRWSQHAFANAIDIGSFQVPDYGRVSVLNHWRDGDEVEIAEDQTLPSRAEYLRAVRSSLCDRFNVVLSPDFNAAHADHYHADLGPFRTCR